MFTITINGELLLQILLGYLIVSLIGTAAIAAWEIWRGGRKPNMKLSAWFGKVALLVIVSPAFPVLAVFAIRDEVKSRRWRAEREQRRLEREAGTSY